MFTGTESKWHRAAAGPGRTCRTPGGRRASRLEAERRRTALRSGPGDLAKLSGLREAQDGLTFDPLAEVGSEDLVPWAPSIRLRLIWRVGAAPGGREESQGPEQGRPLSEGSPRPGRNAPRATGVHGWVTLLPDPPQLPTQPGEGGPPAHTPGVGSPGAHTPGDFRVPVPTVWGGSPTLHLETSAGLALPARPAQLLWESQSTGPKLPRRVEAGGSPTHNRAPDRRWGWQLGPASWVGPAEHRVRQGWAAHTSLGGGFTWTTQIPPPQINGTLLPSIQRHKGGHLHLLQLFEV